MTNNSNIFALGSGEECEKVQRMSRVRAIVLMAVIAFPFSFLLAHTIRQVREEALATGFLVALLAVMMIFFAWLVAWWMRRIDELDRLDNLWATHVGLYFYAGATIGWHVLWDAGVVTRPSTYWLFIATFIVICMTYLVRKLGFR